jgi:hypothetical protein
MRAAGLDLAAGADDRNRPSPSLAIPQFDAGNRTHQRIREIAKQLEQQVVEYDVSNLLHFAASRRHIRQLLEQTAEVQELNELVNEMLQDTSAR